MRVTYLELENIKSYSGPTRIDFTLGLNAVCGANGSGKTTVLEAIGYDLFNFLPYNAGAFVREGQKSGTIRVGLTARDDREYQVVRRVGSQSTYYVCDAETGSRLAERQDAVADWIRQYALDMDGESELPALFKNAVGVPQGLMTADFLGSPTTRKSIFDPLLRVEEYRDAFEYLLQTVNYLKDRAAQLGESIARLEAETERIPQWEAEAAGLRESVRQSTTRVAELEADLASAEDEKGRLDRLHETIAALEKDLVGAAAEVELSRSSLQTEQQRLESAESARRAVDESEAGYRRVVTARERLEELRAEERARDQIRNEHATSLGAQKEAYREIERLDAERAECEVAASAAAALVGEVEEQSRIESELHDLEEKLRDKARVDRQIADLDRAMAELQRVVTEREPRIARARGARVEGERLPEVSARLGEIAHRLGELGPLTQQMKTLTEEGRTLKGRRDRMAADTERWRELQGQIEEIRPVAGTLDDLSTRQRALADRRTELTATIEYRRLARTQLQGAHCPLLELECPVVVRDDSALLRLDNQEAALVAEAEAVETELGELAPEVEAARAAAATLQELQLQSAGLARSAADLETVSADLEACRERYRELQGRVASEAELTVQRRELEAEVSRLQEAVKLGAEVVVLEEQDARDRDVLAVQAAELDDQHTLLAALAVVDEQVGSARGRLAELSNPQRRQQELLMHAGRKPAVEARLEAAEGRLREVADRVKALSAAQTPYEGLDEQLEAEKVVVEQHKDAYERFLRFRDEAAQVEARREAMAAAQAGLESAERRAAGVGAELEGRRGEYNAERHARLMEKCDATRRALAAQGSTLEHQVEDLRRSERELERLRRQDERRRAEVQERERVGRVADAVRFIRETIKAAGPAVTETLLKSISQGANDIYAEIMDDHSVELRWDRDYEVIVQSGAEERKFVQLSGGEQMSAALAVRLALLKEMSEVDFAFFDEPTQNMDGDRRSNLADQIRQVRGFDQLIVISHDDTFEHHTDNLILLQKDHDETAVQR